MSLIDGIGSVPVNGGGASKRKKVCRLKAFHLLKEIKTNAKLITSYIWILISSFHILYHSNTFTLLEKTVRVKVAYFFFLAK